MSAWYSPWVVQYRRAGSGLSWAEDQRRFDRIADARKVARGWFDTGCFVARVGRYTDMGWDPEPNDAERLPEVRQ